MKIRVCRSTRVLYYMHTCTCTIHVHGHVLPYCRAPLHTNNEATCRCDRVMYAAAYCHSCHPASTHPGYYSCTAVFRCDVRELVTSCFDTCGDVIRICQHIHCGTVEHREPGTRLRRQPRLVVSKIRTRLLALARRSRHCLARCLARSRLTRSRLTRSRSLPHSLAARCLTRSRLAALLARGSLARTRCLIRSHSLPHSLALAASLARTRSLTHSLAASLARVRCLARPLPHSLALAASPRCLTCSRSLPHSLALTSLARSLPHSLARSRSLR